MSVHEPDETLAAAISSTIRHLTTPQQSSQCSFNYLGLPQGLRRLILLHTDLVSHCDRQWRPRMNRPDISSAGACDCKSYGEPFFNEAGCRCPPYPYQQRADDPLNNPCCSECTIESYSYTCFCPVGSNFLSSTCRCYTPRHSLFSVSRQVREDAMNVYYSENRFLITPYGSPQYKAVSYDMIPIIPLSWGRMIQTELSLYLSEISRLALLRIRWMELMLPWTGELPYITPVSPAWPDFIETLHLMKSAMSLNALTFVILIPCEASDFLESGEEPKNNKYCALNPHLFKALRTLGTGGLKDFFVHCIARRPAHIKSLHEERLIERFVMGEAYDSTKKGKFHFRSIDNDEYPEYQST
ncbi:hypothetical protein BU24DRAFT_61432 [Aaosphaeria arxii CBS 175.79]|uniref:Uncharacterized protein n=1 Tax=Aaosphaeria arxii CBS 175.79 TaxID=1450172 RepID=A0A6A5XCH9_9PLEO|nr:uncharacterized protein BU24DRAFT_61432 [Aaosphaeria arxii CBS 175.79]KAF2010601.1 hypothetical protein BU24DRAFT_61432 [Aaosphaeria arxii CBS 175.79]